MADEAPLGSGKLYHGGKLLGEIVEISIGSACSKSPHGHHDYVIGELDCIHCGRPNPNPFRRNRERRR